MSVGHNQDTHHERTCNRRVVSQEMKLEPGREIVVSGIRHVYDGMFFKVADVEDMPGTYVYTRPL